MAVTLDLNTLSDINPQTLTLNPSNPNITMRILHTVFHTFPMVLMMRIC